MQSYADFSNKYKAVLIFIMFYCILVYFFFSNPIVFISFFIKKINRPFFIIDINIFAKQFIYISFFIAYIVYIPFIAIILIRWLLSSSTLYFYSIWIQLLFSVLYRHFISFRYNQYDFINFYQNSIFNTYIEGIDLAYLIIQYKGFFWDFFIIFFFFISFIIYIFNFPKNSIIYIYDINNLNGSTNQSVLKQIWIVRFFRYIVIFYFFSGESFINDIFISFFIFIFVEIIFITFRFCFFQNIQKSFLLLNYITIFIVLERHSSFYNFV